MAKGRSREGDTHDTRRFNGLAGYAVSPDGARLACWHAFEAGASKSNPAVRLYCYDTRDGGEAFAGDADGELRALAWIDDELLLVQREFQGVTSLSLHAMPDGGLVAQRELDFHKVEGGFQVTPDRRAALWVPVTLERAEPVGAAVVLGLDDLSVRAEIEHSPAGSVRHRVSSLSGAALEPDGAHVAVSLSRGAGWKDNSVGDLQVFPARAKASAVVNVEGISNAPVTRLAWLDADVLVALRDDGHGEQVAVVEGLRRVNARVRPLTRVREVTEMKRPLAPLGVDVAGRCVVAALGDLGDDRIPCPGVIYRISVDSGDAEKIGEGTFHPKQAQGLRALPHGEVAVVTTAREGGRLTHHVEVLKLDGTRSMVREVKPTLRQRITLPDTPGALIARSGTPRNFSLTCFRSFTTAR